MGWYPTIIENTIEENLTDAFMKDLFAFVKNIAIRNKEAIDEGRYEDLEPLPTGFNETSAWPDDDYLFEDFIEDSCYMLFCDDHMEHIGKWLYDDRLKDLFKRHKINGRFELFHEDSGGYEEIVEFVDGVMQ